MKTTINALLTATLMGSALAVQAATQGTIGTGPDATSQGSFDITLQVVEKIIVKDFQDLPLTTDGAAAGQPIEGTETFCVGGIGFPSFSVDLASGNSTNAGEYYLEDTSSNQLQYFVSFANNTTATTLADGTEPTVGSNSISGSFTSFGNLGCNTDNSTVVVNIPATEWESATVAGDYSDTLTVTVAAN